MKRSCLNQSKPITWQSPFLRNEKTESTGIDDNILPVESNEAPPVEDKTKLPQPETQNEILPTDTTGQSTTKPKYLLSRLILRNKLLAKKTTYRLSPEMR